MNFTMAESPSSYRRIAQLICAILMVTYLFGLPNHSCSVHATSTSSPKAALTRASDFDLPGVDGKAHKLSEYRGHPIAMFFFCGCDWCHRTAKIWAQMQKAGALSSESPGMRNSPVTIIVFQGDASAASQFIQQTGLDPTQTVALTDQSMHVTLDIYHASICPRVFVVDPHGDIVYTNNHTDDRPRVAPEIVIATRALEAVRKAVGY